MGIAIWETESRMEFEKFLDVIESQKLDEYWEKWLEDENMKTGLAVAFEKMYYEKHGVWPVGFDPRSFTDWDSYEKVANEYFKNSKKEVK